MLLLELQDCLISRLQKVQNAAARMAVCAGRRDHISPILKRLHWLPIRQRIVFKALVLTFRGLHGLAPNYIFVLLRWYVPGRHLQYDLPAIWTFMCPCRMEDMVIDALAWQRQESGIPCPLELKAASSLISFK